MFFIKHLISSLFIVFLLCNCGGISHAADQEEFLENDKPISKTIKQARNGELRRSVDTGFEAWSQKSQAWVDPKIFWLEYADERGGLTWGETDTYPPYNEVKELDTMIIKLESGICMMEFWHRRWRRANDVRRWDDKFNDYSACPVVFD